MPTIERPKAEILDALLSKEHGHIIEEKFFPDTQRTGYRLIVDTSIVIDKQHLEAL